MAVTLADIEKLSVAEKIQLVEDIWDSIAAHPENIPLTQAQKDELDRRLAAYRENPEPGASWEDVKEEIERSIRG